MDKILELLLKNPELIVQMAQEFITKYKPLAYVMAQEVVNVYKDYSNNVEYPTITAKVKKNMYDAYVAVGFTEEQALALMINDNIQLMKNIKQLSTSGGKVSSKVNI